MASFGLGDAQCSVCPFIVIGSRREWISTGVFFSIHAFSFGEQRMIDGKAYGDKSST